MRAWMMLFVVAGCGDRSATIDAHAPDTPGGGDASNTALWYAGVNLAGAEFGEQNLPGTYGVDYTYPTNAEVDYFRSKGMTLLRVPFRWERLQQSLGGALDATEKGRLDTFVDYATGAGMTVLLDPHNYARYRDALIG